MAPSRFDSSFARDNMTTPTTPVVERTVPVRAISTPELAASIARRLAECSHDELRVLHVVLDRVLRVGRESYAPLDLARDERDWGREAQEELSDTLFYLAARHVAATDRRLERMRCEAADARGPIEAGLAELRVAEVVTAPPRHWLAELDEEGR